MSVAEIYDDEPPPSPASRRASAATRIPPHDLRAEESLLGAMLLSRDAIAAATEVGLSGDDFYKPAHGHVFDAITSLYARGDSVDPVTVADLLRRRELLDAIGGPATLVTLQAGTPATTTAGKYARIVEEHALLRRLIAVAGEIAENAYGLPDDVPATIDRAETLVFEVAQHRVTDSTSKIGDLLDANLNRLEALYERKETITGIPTGYDDLDEILAGLQPSNLVVVGARPAMGKCLAASARVLDPDTGALTTMGELAARAAAAVPFGAVAYQEALGRLVPVRPSVVVDDGIKPTWTVRTRLGREVTATATHPFLVHRGWKPLAELRVGEGIAVPRTLPFFGTDELPDHEVELVALLLGDGGLAGTTPLFTTACPRLASAFRGAVEAHGCTVRAQAGAGPAVTYRIGHRSGETNHVAAMLRRHGLMGHGVHATFVPEAVFRLPRRQLALFLSCLFATDGSAGWTDAGGGYGRISYSTVSERLAHDVQHLLLRFGLCARLRRRSVAAAGRRRAAYEVELVAADDIVRFVAEIGTFAKEEQVSVPVARCRAKATEGWTAGTLAVETSADIVTVEGRRSRAERSAAVGTPRNHDRQAHRSPQRQSVLTLEEAIDEVGLDVGGCDVCWDEIVSITFAGHQPVYDLTVASLHNFVADDMLVHNTAFALGMAAHASLTAQRPVLVFSLEMSQLEVSQRILCADARVDSTRVRTGRLTESDWGKLSHAVGRLAEAPIYIDDNANITVMDIRAKARRLRSKLGDLGLVIIDYVQLMTGRSSAESRQVEVSEISRSLKILARELDTPVVALAQLNRQLEQRADKRPMLSDLRESGCLTADTRLLRADTDAEVTLGELVASGARDVPVWSLDDRWRLVPATLSHAFPSGTKPTFRLRLASGRTVDATANHRFRTLDDWMPLGALAVGDRLAVPRRLAAPSDCEPVDEDELVRLVHLPGDGCGLPSQPVHDTSADAANLDAAEVAAHRRFGDVLWDRIVGTEPLGERPVFDATVLGTHNFVANGIVAHNSLEQDADVVLFLYRDEVYNAESTDRGTAEVIVSKHRNGPVGKIRLAWLDHYTKFANMAKGV